MSLAKRQRALICDLLLELGPDAPTLNEGWKTQDLAAHLWIREHKPQAMLGMFVKKYEAFTERVQTNAVATHGYTALVERLRTPALMVRPVDAVMNGAEFFIHHMDVLRANDRDQTLSSHDEDSLRAPLKMFAAKVAKGYGDRLVLDSNDGKQLELGRGTRPVHVIGKPSELILFVSGRTEDAKVDLVGEPEAVQKLIASAGGI
ncbi:MAG: TIGR03085 family metal-binding protein [Arachnia sp.]